MDSDPSRHQQQRRSPRVLAAIAVAFFTSLSAPPLLHAGLIMDESSHTLTGSVGSVTGGRLTGFEFTTPVGPSFTVGEIKGSWYSSGYSGATDFRIYSRLGADLTPVSTAVSIASIPSTSTATFDFATHATTIDFSSQSILLDPNTAYTLLAEHNGGGGTLGIHFSFSAGTGPIVGAGRISGSNSLDDASFEDHNDMTFQVFDAAPVPEPGTLLFIGSAAILLLTRRSRLC